MAGLSLIGTYSSESESEEETKVKKFEVTKAESTVERLPLPHSILSWKGVTHHEEVVDDPSEHEGRLRSFKHERGNWAALVYIRYEAGDSIHSWMETVQAQLGIKALEIFQEFHISLTRSLILKFHWIESFVDSVRKVCQHTDRFALELIGVKAYCNEERTRTFLGIVCEDKNRSLKGLIKALDELLAEYQLQPFYEEASFHVSFMWCLGDKEDQLNACLPSLNTSLNNMLDGKPMESCVQVDEINCKIGNKMYKCILK